MYVNDLNGNNSGKKKSYDITLVFVKTHYNITEPYTLNKIIIIQ